MASSTDICNLALSFLGEPPIANIDNPQTKTGELCKLHYPILRDAVLQEVEWSFAVRRYSSSTPVATSPNWGYQYAYDVSGEVLRVTYCSDDANEDFYNPEFKWVFENNLILCDASKIYYRTINLVTDTQKYSALFIQALAARMALEMCVSITESTELMSGLVSLYGVKMKAAATTDSLQGKAKRFRVGKLKASRGGI